MVPAEARASAGCFFGGERKRDGNTEITEDGTQRAQR